MPRAPSSPIPVRRTATACWPTASAAEVKRRSTDGWTRSVVAARRAKSRFAAALYGAVETARRHIDETGLERLAVSGLPHVAGQVRGEARGEGAGEAGRHVLRTTTGTRVHAGWSPRSRSTRSIAGGPPVDAPRRRSAGGVPGCRGAAAGPAGGSSGGRTWQLAGGELADAADEALAQRFEVDEGEPPLVDHFERSAVQRLDGELGAAAQVLGQDDDRRRPPEP